ncbi:MAG: purine-binding chemotaxis protein CheW [Deltaproteobacteria bacterium]|nr:purine-binding chemotaxis protein CheW [Deltaproteobacteria bacterium]
MKRGKPTAGAERPPSPADGGRVSPAAEAGEWIPTQEERRRILRQRARALARVPEREPAGERLQVVEFLVSSERYGIESAYVGEVYPLKDLAPIPCTPPFVLGVVNVRGRILSVLDLRKFFDLPEKGPSDLNKVLILGDGAMEFGVLADEILGFRSLPADALQPSLPTLTEVRAEYLKGVTRERLVVLDGSKILSDPRIVVHEEV